MNKPKFKGFEKESGELVKTAFLDAYPVGDRLLEEVMFKASVGEDGSLSVVVCDSSKPYFDTLNTKKWNKAVLRYAEQNDIFSEREDGGEDLVLV